MKGIERKTIRKIKGNQRKMKGIERKTASKMKGNGYCEIIFPEKN